MRGSAGLQQSFLANLQAAGDDDSDDQASPPGSPPVPQPSRDRKAVRSPPGSPPPARQPTPATGAVHRRVIDWSQSGPGGSSSGGPASPPRACAAQSSGFELKPASEVSR